MNLIVLMAGEHRTTLTREPTGLLPVNGHTIIEHIAEKIAQMGDVANIVFIIREVDKKQFHLDSVIKLAIPRAKILALPVSTKGAACSALLCTDLISIESETVAINGDEYLKTDFSEIIRYFHSRNADGGLVTFESLHPSFSFVSLAKDGTVEQVAEKNPISKNATVGFYYFRSYRMLVESVKQMIRKDAQVNGLFYLSPAFNEMILKGLRVVAKPVPASDFHPLKSDLQITNFIR